MIPVQTCTEALPRAHCPNGHPAHLVCSSRQCGICAFICRQCDDLADQHGHEERLNFILEKSLSKMLSTAQGYPTDQPYLQTVYQSYTRLLNMIAETMQTYQTRVRQLLSNTKPNEELERIRSKIGNRDFSSVKGSEIHDLLASFKDSGERHQNIKEITKQLELEKKKMTDLLGQLISKLQPPTLTVMQSEKQIVPEINLQDLKQEEVTEVRPEVQQSKAVSSAPQSELLEAAKLYESQKYEQAEDALRQYLSRNPNNFEALNYLGLIQEQGKRDLEMALYYYQESIRCKPDSTQSLMLAAALHYKQGRLEKATEYANRTLQLNSDQPNAHNLLGSISMSRDEPKKALEYYNKAIELGDSQSVYYENREAALNKLKTLKAKKSGSKKPKKIDLTRDPQDLDQDYIPAGLDLELSTQRKSRQKDRPAKDQPVYRPKRSKLKTSQKKQDNK